MVVCSKSCKFSPNRWFFVLFDEMRHFLQLFPEKFIEMQRHGSLLEKLQSFGEIDDFLCFFTNWATFCNLLLKSSSKQQNMVVCSKNHRFSQNFATFRPKYHIFAFRWTFSGKSCKKCLISGKSTTNHRFGQNFATFGTSCHVFAFRWTFQQKVPHFVKKHENLSIWPKLATFRTNYHVLAFRWTIQQKVAKSRSCREKARKIIDFSKTCKFFEQTTMSWRFEDLFSKKYLISWKERKIIDWAKTLQLFEQTTNFWRLRQLLSRTLQKLPHFVKKQEKSPTWPKLATFRTKYHVFAFRWTFKEKKVPHFMKSTKTHRFGKKHATFRTNYHVLASQWLLQ